MRAYFDHASTTPMISEAIEAMSEQLARTGNPSSLHGSGRSARRVVEESRELIASRLGAKPPEVIFTGGGTEADNLAIKGAWWAAQRTDPTRNRVVCSAVEHHAVLDSVGWTESQGAEVLLIPVDSDGRVEMAALRAEITSSTAVASLMWANNEVGTLQPVRELADLAAQAGALSHSDAVQAVGHVAVDFGASGLDLLSVAAHKLGGPRGVGALLTRRGIELTPLLHGGGQERDVRSGTLDVAAIAGFAAAVEVAGANLEREGSRLRALRARLVEVLTMACPEAVSNTPDLVETIPGIVNITFPGCEADAMLLLLDAAGIDCATGSACSAGLAQPSHVLLAMGRTERAARSSLRFSLGHTTTAADLDQLAAALPEALDRARLAGSFIG